MRKLLLVFCIFIISCSGKKTNEIYLFNDVAFNLKTGENITIKSEEITNKYNHYFNSANTVQAPLFKYIKHKDYEIFIGIPFNTSIKAIKELDSQTTDNASFICNKSDSLYVYQQLKVNNLYITKYYSYVGNKPSLLYFATATESENISNSLFSKQEIDKRIKIQDDNK